MNLPSLIYLTRWLVRDTFRQARFSKVLHLMVGLSLICVVVCLSVGTPGLPPRPRQETPERLPKQEAGRTDPERLKGSGVDVIEGELTLAFGAVRIPWSKYRDDAVNYLQVLLLGLVGDTGGILLTLIWTAGFLPQFLEPSNATVLLTRPVGRATLLLGKFLGVLAFVASQVLLFVGGIWLALAVRTGVWDPTCFLAVPVLLLHFAIFFSFSVLLAVATRSTIACAFGSLLFWLVCLGMNLGRHAVHVLPDLQGLSPLLTFLSDAGYWVLPKPADLNLLFVEALGGTGEFAQPFDKAALLRQGAWHPELSVVASVGFATVLLGIAAREFVLADY